MIIPGSDTHFLEVGAYASLKVAADDFFREKENINFRILSYFSKAKMEECDQKVLKCF